jgi:predicted PurR-regulated permease PerM
LKKINKNEKNNFYAFLVAYIVSLILLAIIFRPFAYPLILGIVLGIFFFPLNKLLIKKGMKPNLSSLLIVLVILILIIISSYVFVNSLVKEATQTYRIIETYDFKEADETINRLLGINVSSEEIILPIIANINETFTISIPKIISSIAEIVLGLFIMLFLLFYVFKDGENMMQNVLNILPVSHENKEKIKEESRKVLYGVMYGQVLIAIIQGFLGGFAFYIFGINNPVFWGLIMGVLALIPMLGTPAIWIPAGIIQIMNGELFSGIGLLVFGSTIMFTLENIVRPRYIGKKSGMHPIIVILAIFGGIKLFGIIGLIIGPILVALCVLVIKIFNQEILIEKQKNQNQKN